MGRREVGEWQDSEPTGSAGAPCPGCSPQRTASPSPHLPSRHHPSPRAMRSTRMMRMMVGLMGSAALISISSSVMPMTDSSTMAKSSWFHLLGRVEEGRVGLRHTAHGMKPPHSSLWLRPTGLCGPPPCSPSRGQWIRPPLYSSQLPKPGLMQLNQCL